MDITASKVMELREMTGAAMMDCKKALNEAEGDFEKAKEILRKKGQTIVLKKLSREAKEGLISIASTKKGEKIDHLAVLKLACETDFVARNEKFQALQTELTQLLLKNGKDGFGKNMSQGEVKTKIEQAVSEFGENILIAEHHWFEAKEGYLGCYLHTNKKIATVVLGTTSSPSSLAHEEVFREIALHIAANRVLALNQNQIPKEEIEKERNLFREQLLASDKKPDLVEKIVANKVEKFLSEVCLMEQPFLKNPDLKVKEWLQEQSKKLNTPFLVKEFFKISF